MSVTDQIIKEFPAVLPENWATLFLKETKQDQIQEHHSYLGFDFLPFYTPRTEDAKQAALLQQLSTGRDERWYITRYIPINDIAAAHSQILEALGKGVSSITLVGDLHHQQETVALLKEVMADYIEINFVSNDPLLTAKNYLDWCQHHASTNKVFGAFYHDPLAEALINGGWKNGQEKDLDILAERFKLVTQHTSKLQPITIDATIYHYAGASLVQTIAYALAHAVEYLHALQTRGIQPVTAINRMVFKWPVGTSFFAETAALRALRLTWNSLCRHLTGNKNDLYKISVHAETSLHTWSVADMYNNMLRATTQAMSAIAGGASGLYINPYNVVSTHANDFAERMAVNVQLLLREESFFAKAADPAAGAYLVEALTRQLAEKALDLFKKTEAAGGLIQQVKAGTLQTELAQNMALMTEAVKKGEIKILGLNLYPNKNENVGTLPKAPLFHEPVTGHEFTPLKRQRLAEVLEAQ